MKFSRKHQLFPAIFTSYDCPKKKRRQKGKKEVHKHLSITNEMHEMRNRLVKNESKPILVADLPFAS
jgi:uncharacterized membrane protein (DUF106 family)